MKKQAARSKKQVIKIYEVAETKVQKNKQKRRKKKEERRKKKEERTKKRKKKCICVL